MNKKSQQYNSHQSKMPRVFEVKSIDELAVMSEEELQGREYSLQDDLRSKRLAPLSSEASPWETELAYVQREQEIRRARKSRHREYMEKLRGEEVDENSLPEYQGNPPPTWF